MMNHANKGRNEAEPQRAYMIRPPAPPNTPAGFF